LNTVATNLSIPQNLKDKGTLYIKLFAALFYFIPAILDYNIITSKSMKLRRKNTIIWYMKKRKMTTREIF